MKTSKSCAFAVSGDNLIVRVGVPGAGSIVELLDRHGNGTARAMAKNAQGNTVSIDLGNYELVTERSVPLEFANFY